MLQEIKNRIYCKLLSNYYLLYTSSSGILLNQKRLYTKYQQLTKIVLLNWVNNFRTLSLWIHYIIIHNYRQISEHLLEISIL